MQSNAFLSDDNELALDSQLDLTRFAHQEVGLGLPMIEKKLTSGATGMLLLPC